MSSVSTKKRRKTDDSDEADGGDNNNNNNNDDGIVSNGGSPHRNVRRAFRPQALVDNPDFARTKEKLYHMGNTEVMKHFQPVFDQLELSSTVPSNGIPAFAQEGIIDCRWFLASYHDLYARPTADVIVSGQEDVGQLGLVSQINVDNIHGYGPTLLQDLRGKIIQVAAGGQHSLALTHDGFVFSWGGSERGSIGRLLTAGVEQQLGETTPTPVTKLCPSMKHRVSNHQVRSPENEWKDVIAVAAGSSHSLFLTISGNAYASGMYSNGDGKDLCDERPPDCPNKSDKRKVGSVVGQNLEPAHVYKMPGRAKFIAASGAINAAILEDDQCYTWGFGFMGELARSDDMTDMKDEDGLPDIGPKFHMETKTLRDANTGKEYEERSFKEDIVKEHFLKPKAVLWDKALPKIQRMVTHVACGGNHLLVAARAPEDSSSRLFTAGQGAHGRLGHGDQTNRHALTLVEALKDVPIARVAAGQEHSLILHAKGDTVYICGNNGYNQLGLPRDKLDFATDALARGVPVHKRQTYVLLPTVVPLPIPADGRLDKIGRIVDISCGDSHNMAITAGGRLYTWGMGEYGQCGNNPKYSPEDVTPRLNHDWLGPNTQLFFHQASGGAQHSLFLASRFKKEGLPEGTDPRK